MITGLPENLFWYWVTERHEIYLRRQQGLPRPWTHDPILQHYKFCNVFRELDRGTVWLRENFLDPHRDARPDLTLFNCAWYRMFNWWKTAALLGWQTRWSVEKIYAKLARVQGQVFTGAHIVYSEPGVSKVFSIVGVCGELFSRRREFLKVARETRSLQATHRALKTVFCIGDFMAYEIVTDLRHTAILGDATDIMTWANVGPGALRGLRRLDGFVRPSQGVERMRYLLDVSKERLPFLFPRLEMRDVEHSLCEFDKYCRVKFGEGKPRSKYAGGPE